MIPVGDLTPRRTFPFVNFALIAANVVIFFLYAFRPESEVDAVFTNYALRPDAWSLKTLLTSMFLHGGLMHLFGNMLFLGIAGDNVEDRLGRVSYGVFYLTAGLAGSAAHIMTASMWGGGMADKPTVGASGAISGVLGAYLVFFPGGRIRFMVWPVPIRTIILPAWAAITAWVATQVLMGYDQMGGHTTNVAVFAHLGGFAFGFAAALLLRLLGRRPRA